MFNVNNQITFELTNRCNARCPLCPRTGDEIGGVAGVVARPGFMDISLELMEKLAHHGSRAFSYCGNYGDPIAHPKAMDIFKLVNKYKITQHINSNGSMQSTKWWKELGGISKMKVTFALDGLEDTHSIYRINTDFNKILANAKAYIDAGGKAIWCFIVFSHNEHQVDEARIMAKELGFHRFDIKISSRELNTAFNKGINDVTTVENSAGKIRKTKTAAVQVITINAPTIEKYQSEAKKHGRKIAPIKCYAIDDNKMYVGPDEYMVPCCGVHSDVHRQRYGQNTNYASFIMFLNECDIKYDLTKHDLNVVLDSYNNNLSVLEEYWDSRSIRVCNERCGSNIVTEVIHGDTKERKAMWGGLNDQDV